MYTNAILNKNMDEIASQDENITIVDPTNILYAKKKLDFFKKMVYISTFKEIKLLQKNF